jgi:hypothetical protein
MGGMSNSQCIWSDFIIGRCAPSLVILPLRGVIGHLALRAVIGQ